MRSSHLPVRPFCICINHETVCWIFMKFGAGVLYEKLSHRCEFREKRLIGSHALRRRFQENFALFSIYFVRFWQNSVKKVCTTIYYVSARSLKISIVRGILRFMGEGGVNVALTARFGITDLHEMLLRDFQFREDCRRERRISLWVSVKLHLYINCANVRHSDSKERLD
jgi:hypothetical protein